MAGEAPVPATVALPFSPTVWTGFAACSGWADALPAGAEGFAAVPFERLNTPRRPPNAPPVRVAWWVVAAWMTTPSTGRVVAVETG